MVTPSELYFLKMKFKVLGIVELGVSCPDEGTMDSKGYKLKVALCPGMFSNGLKLPFCHPVCYVLDFLSLAIAHSTQMHEGS